MAWVDVLRILLGRKTQEEKEIEIRFEEALKKHEGSDGEVRDLQEKLYQTRQAVHARISRISEEDHDRPKAESIP